MEENTVTKITYSALENRAQIESARQHVFIADIEEALRTNHGIYNGKLQVICYPYQYGITRYVHFWDENGAWITEKDNSGKGHHVHGSNGSGTPEAIAYSLANSLKWYRAKEAAKKQ